MEKSNQINKAQGVGVNLRLEYIDEVLDKRPKGIDYFEIIPDNFLTPGPHHHKLEQINKQYKLSFHCVNMNIGGIGKLNESYLAQIRELIEHYQPIYLSDHLALEEFNGVYFHDLLPLPYTDASLDNAATRVDYLQNFFQRELLIENLSVYDSFDNQYTEVEFLNKLGKLTDCKFLFDLNNIWVNELNGGEKASTIINQIDIKRVEELHIAAPNLDGAPFIDTHEDIPTPEVFELLKNVLKIKPNLHITYERDDNLPTYVKWLDELNYVIEKIHEK